MKYTVFQDKRAYTMELCEQNFDEFADSLEGLSPGHKDSAQLIKLASFTGEVNDKGCLRTDAFVHEIYGIEGDYDAEVVTPQEAQRLLTEAGIQAVIVTTHRHAPSAPRWRVFANLSCPHTPQSRWGLLARLNGVLGGVLARESFTLSQSYYVGRPVEGEYLVLRSEGMCLDLLEDLPEVGPIKAAKTGALEVKEADAHHTVLDLSSCLVRAGLPNSAVYEAMGVLAGYIAHIDPERAKSLPSETRRAVDGAFEKYAPEKIERVDPSKLWLYQGGFADIPYVAPPADYCGGWLRAGSYTIMYARAGVGKTAVCADLVYSLKAGRFWMGMMCTDPGRIAWVNGDMPLWQVSERLGYLKGVEGIDLIHVDGPNFMEYQDELVDKLSCYKVAMLDNWSALFDLGDSNAAENWRAYNALIKRICATGCAVVTQTHEGKGEGTSSFGSSAQEWPAHTIIRLSRREITESEFNQCPGITSSHARKASWVKCRMGAQPEDVVFQLAIDERGRLHADIAPFIDKFGDSRLARKKPY